MTSKEPDGGWVSSTHDVCRSCALAVPVGAFCGSCGTAASARRGDGPSWLRLRSHAAAPNEHALLPSVTTSLFPHLPRRSRSGFRVGVVVLALLLVALVMLRWLPPLIGISAFGLPVLFVLYLAETGLFAELPARTLVVVATLGIGTGIGWWYATDAIWSITYDDVLATPMTTAETLVNLVIVPAVGLALLLLPVVVLRLRRRDGRESLDGFVIGAFGAFCFTTAGLLTGSVPEFANGLVASDYPTDALFALAAIRGVAAPLTAAAVGGMMGATLWFRRRPDGAGRWYRSWLTSPVTAGSVALLIYVAQNAIDYAWITYVEIVGLYAALAVLALLALRVVLHCALLGEVSDGVSPDQAVLCQQCEHVVPDLAFCVNCGISANAATRASRQGRRSSRPVPVPVDVSHDGR